MVVLNKIYTRTGDKGTTGLATGERVEKWNLRVEAYGAVDETNAALGVARLHCAEDGELDAMLGRIQNDLFDLGADLATPERDKPLGWEPLRIVEAQVIRPRNRDRPDQRADRAPQQLHPARGLRPRRPPPRRAHHLPARRTPDCATRATPRARKSRRPPCAYANRLSDFLFVAARRANNNGASDVLWVPGANR